jgi:predicted AlkP superfamily phosphohydrolase/phosphomutase
VDVIYQQVDRWVGELIGLLPSDASVLFVSDHGMKPGHAAGEHTPLGLWVARRPELNTGRGIDGATVLDVAPTVLQMFRAPIPVDMDGKVAVQLFDSDWLNEHPARYSTEDSSLASVGAATEDGTEEALEQLRTLGYIE